MTTTIEVDGKASVSMEPDTMLVTLELEAGGARAAVARDREADRRETILDALATVVDERDVHVASKSVRETSDLFDAAVDDPYTARTTLEVRCLPRAVDDVVVTATDHGALVEELEPMVTDGRRTEIRAELLTAAVENAREQAEHIARTVGQSIDQLEQLATTHGSGFDSLVDDALASQVSTDAATGPVEFSTSVTATYELEGVTAKDRT